MLNPLGVAQIQLFDGPGHPFRWETMDLPSHLRPGEVLVSIRLATICGSDLHTIGGARPAPTPSILGHEAIGTVVDVGPDRGDLAPGDSVTWTIAASCGECAPCVHHDLPQKCRQLFKYGHAAAGDGSGLNGYFASHILLRPGTHILQLEEEGADPILTDKVLAAANCALGTAVNATEALPDECHTALVQGAGLVGIYTCALLREKGVGAVYVTDVSDARLRLIEDFGGIPFDARTGPIHEAMGWNQGEGVDAAFEVAGHSALVPDGVAALRAGGHYTFVGMVHPDTPLGITGDQVIRKCLTMRGIHNYGPRHLDSAIDFLRSTAGTYPFANLVSDPIPLADLEKAVDLARTQEYHRVAVAPIDR